MKTTRIVAILLLPLMFAACSVRQLSDGSYTTCKAGEACQVREGSVEAVKAKHKKKKMKKAPAAKAVEAPASAEKTK